MTTPTALAERIERLGKPFDERADLLVVRGTPLATAEEREAWVKLRATPPPFATVTVKYAGTDLDLEPGTPPAADDLFQITVRKKAPADEMRLFFAASLTKMGASLATVTRVRVARMAPAERFDTFRARFEPWADDQPAADGFASQPVLTDPRELVRDLTGSAAVPSDLRPWLLHAPPPVEGETYAAWLRLAGRQLFAALANQVTKDAGGNLAYGFNGPPRRTVSLATVKPEDEAPFAGCLQKAAAWVFTEGPGEENRHILLSSEWARTYNPHVPEPPEDVCGQALDSAHLAHGAYVRSASRETLSALGKLREAVVEESQKTRQRAQDLAGSLWKDLAVASAPFVLKILADAGKVAGNRIAASVAFAAAAFLVLSFGIQAYLNERFFEHQGDSRKAWQQALGKMLTAEEIDEISVQPIARSMTTYDHVLGIVLAIYAALVVALYAFGTATLHSRSAPARSSAPSADSAARQAAADTGARDTTRIVVQPPDTGGAPVNTSRTRRR